MEQLRKILLVASLLGLFGLLVLPSGAFAQTSSGQSQEAGEDEEAERPPQVQRRTWQGAVLRVITEDDYPPFNYLDEEGVLTGFNIDLVKAICVQMEVVCDIKTGKWDSLIPALENGEADVIAASLAISVKNFQRVDFTDRYFQMPARFASQKRFEVDEMIPEEVEGEKIGVVKGTAHEAYLRDFFYDAEIVLFESAEDARAALLEEKVALIFDDGTSLMFWVNGLDSGGCCVLKGGAFTEAKYFGEGLGFAVSKGNRVLRETLNESLEAVRKSGRFEELYLRYFPLRFY